MDKITNTRCVVTGLGMISAIGNNVDECFANALAGKTGIDKVASVDTTDCYANLGAEVHCDTLDEIDEAKDVDRVSKLCLKASKEALDDAGLVIDESNAGRVGVVMGSCVGGVVSVENYVTKGEHAEDINKMTIASIANHVANMAGAKGVVTNVGNACAASTISIAYACELIRAGVADAFIVGGADAFASVPFSGFLALHARHLTTATVSHLVKVLVRSSWRAMSMQRREMRRSTVTCFQQESAVMPIISQHHVRTDLDRCMRFARQLRSQASSQRMLHM